MYLKQLIRLTFHVPIPEEVKKITKIFILPQLSKMHRAGRLNKKTLPLLAINYIYISCNVYS